MMTFFVTFFAFVFGVAIYIIAATLAETYAPKHQFFWGWLGGGLMTAFLTILKLFYGA